MGSCCEQQEMIGGISQEFPEPVAQTLLVLSVGRHAVGLVNNYEIPRRLAQAWEDVSPLSQV